MSRRRVITVLTILSLSLLVGPAWAGPNTWTASGPTGGAIRAVLVEDPTAPSASSTVYVGTLGSGVFKSGNGGDSWAQSGLDGFNIRALVRDPATLPLPTLYAGAESGAGGAPGGVFSSQNGGVDWTPVDTPDSPTRRCRRSLSTARRSMRAPPGAACSSWIAGTWSSVNARVSWRAGECSNVPPPGAVARHRFENPGHRVRRHRRGRGVQVHSIGALAGCGTRRPTNQGFRSDCLEKAEILALLVDETSGNGDALRRREGQRREQRLQPEHRRNRSPRSGTRLLQVREQRSPLGSQDERDVRGSDLRRPSP